MQLSCVVCKAFGLVDSLLLILEFQQLWEKSMENYQLKFMLLLFSITIKKVLFLKRWRNCKIGTHDTICQPIFADVKAMQR